MASGRQRIELGTGNDASVVLDLLRAASAQVVCVGHAVSFFGVSWLLPPHLPYFQNLAVAVFFFLSGLLIGDTMLKRSTDPDYGFGRYVVDRFARIYSGWVPALVFVALVDLALVLSNLHAHPQYVTMKAFLGNLFMLQMYRGPLDGLRGVPNFGSAGPFWTLAIEFHIYMFVGALFFILRGRATWAAMLCALLFAALPCRYLFGAVQPGLGTGLFSVWLVGFASAIMWPRAPRWACVAVLAASVLAMIVLITPTKEYAWGTYALLAAALWAGDFNCGASTPHRGDAGSACDPAGSELLIHPLPHPLHDPLCAGAYLAERRHRCCGDWRCNRERVGLCDGPIHRDQAQSVRSVAHFAGT
jgi:peptidoglycan/LPS O-acetylase OafA/YrhL